MRAVWIVFALFFGLVQAQDAPGAMLRTRLEPAGPVLVGQPVRLHVDVLVTTWLSGAPVFPVFEMEGALVVLPDERSSNLTEQIDGQSWFGVSRSYLIYAQEAREHSVPAVEITVSPGLAEGPITLLTEQQVFRAGIPAEAQGLGYFVATRDLQLTQELDRKLTDLRVGDSIQRNIKMFADKTFAMFLPPVDFEEVEGLAVYPDPPRVEDRSADRVGFQGGERLESATYVIQKEGDYELAPFEVYWWDLAANRMREATVPAVKFSAAPNPNFVPEIPLPEEEEVEVSAPKKESTLDIVKKWVRPLALITALLIIVVTQLRRLVQYIGKAMVERRRAYEQSEAAAFDQVKEAARKDDAGGLIRFLYQWIDRILPGKQIGTLTSLTGRDRQLDEQLDALLADRYLEGTVKGGWSSSRLIKRLAKIRKGFNRRTSQRGDGENSLPLLNPE